MNNPILIIGQGICGTMLSWQLQKNNIAFLVIDKNQPNSSSKVAAGIINPVTGRRIVKTWLIDTIMPYAVDVYTELQNQLNIEIISEKKIIDFFASQQIEDAFTERVLENADYLCFDNFNSFKSQFNNNFKFGIIEPSYIVQLEKLITKWKTILLEKKQLLEQSFNENDVEINDNYIAYQNQKYSKIIFADGINCYTNKWFKNLPFAFNKGEALIIECAKLNQDFIYKKGITIAPIGNHQFWVGSNYIWNYEDDKITQQFYDATKIQLDQLLKLPYTILNHKAAIRPANIERRPFVGFHPIYKNIGILNGMGAKGTSLAPYFANELVNNILYNSPITNEANVNRFEKILSR